MATPSKADLPRTAGREEALIAADVIGRKSQQPSDSSQYKSIAAKRAVINKVKAATIRMASKRKVGATDPIKHRERRITVIAARIWGNLADATEWLDTPNPVLQGLIPRNLLKTEDGANKVEGVLVALDHGFPV